MTLKQLKDLLASEPPENENLTIQVWLGRDRYVDLTHDDGSTLIRAGNILMVKGA